MSGQVRPLGASSPSRCEARVWASTSWPGVRVARASAWAATAAFAATAAVTRAASARVAQACTDPLMASTWWNSPRARGSVARVAQAPPPADWPPTVTRAGSPPNAAMLPLHPLEPGQPVEHAPVGRRAVDQPEALEAQAVADRHHHHAVTSEVAPVVPDARRGARDVAPAVDPHQHGEPGVTQLRGEHVEAETARRVPAFDDGLGDEGEALCRLGRGRGEGGGVTHAVPAGRPGPARRSGWRRTAARRTGHPGRRSHGDGRGPAGCPSSMLTTGSIGPPDVVDRPRPIRARQVRSSA